MHRIHYAGDSILTGSAIARGVLDYAQALAQVGASATVDVPTRESDGSRGHVEMLIGPASQLSAHEEDEVAGEELEDDARAAHAHGRGAPSPLRTGLTDGGHHLVRSAR